MFKGKSKADFRARREMVGLTQQDIADALGVDVRSVKRWEREGFNDPPGRAWDVIEEFEERFGEAVTVSTDMALANAQAFGTDQVTLTIYRSKEDYDALGRDEGRYGFVNAVTFEVAKLLDIEGMKVAFRYPATKKLNKTRRF